MDAGNRGVVPLSGTRTPRRARSSTYWARQTHRWLGVFIGIQFVLWTVGGLYFSWTDLNEIHGDHLRSPQPQVTSTAGLVSPSVVVGAIQRDEPVDSLAGLALMDLLGRPTYRVDYFSRVDGAAVRKRRLADAVSGAVRQNVTQSEALALARQAYTGHEPVRSAEYLTEGNVGSHHEYRGGPLPAWAVTFDAPDHGLHLGRGGAGACDPAPRLAHLRLSVDAAHDGLCGPGVTSTTCCYARSPSSVW